MSKRPQKAFGVFCRYVGPGGTSVDFFIEKEGLKGIWTNENCPYAPFGITNDPDDPDRTKWRDDTTY